MEDLSEIEKKKYLNFKNLTNFEAYKIVFHDTFMKKNSKGEIIGTTQRKEFLQILHSLMKEKLQNHQKKQQKTDNNNNNEELEILDVGGGAGSLINLVLNFYKNQKFKINCIEPNTQLIKIYNEKIEQSKNHLKKGMFLVKNFEIDDENDNKKILSTKNDLIICIHILAYINSSKKIDLIKRLQFLYKTLNENGSIFIVNTDEQNTIGSNFACKWMELNHQKKEAETLKHCWKFRNQLFSQKEIIKYLNEENKDFECEVKNIKTNSYVYGETKIDLVIASLIGLCESNNEKFDFKKLEFALKTFNQTKEKYGFMKETRKEVEQNGMFRNDCNQIITIITKKKKKTITIKI